jgi:pimeloyl-ACP methyl ester carboxylesterase
MAERASLIAMRDGRNLAYLEVGSAVGSPVFHFHGHGSSRLEALGLADAAEKAGVRLIAFDRPGIGLSDPKLGDRLLDWPLDIAEAADHLGIQRFAVKGMSAGGPYALACAHVLPDRVKSGVARPLCAKSRLCGGLCVDHARLQEFVEQGMIADHRRP